MITITCSNPICGKSFLYDETKFPNAKKVQCPHCKTIQDLMVNEEETPFFEEPEEKEAFIPVPEPKPAKPDPVEPFSAPSSKKEDFFSEVEPGPQQPATIAEEPKKNNRWLWAIPLILILAIIGYFLIPSKPPMEPPVALSPLPAFKVAVSGGEQSLRPGDELSLAIAVSPSPDSGTVVRFYSGNVMLEENDEGFLTLDTAFSESGTKELLIWIEAFRMADSSFVRDTAVFSQVVSGGIQPPNGNGTPPVTRIDLRRKANRANWFANFVGDQEARELSLNTPLKISNKLYGRVNIATSLLLENGEKRNGIEIIPGEKSASRVFAEYSISEMPENPVFSADLGFRDAGESNTVKGEVTFEIRAQMPDGSYRSLGLQSKKYDQRLLHLEYPIIPQNTRKIRIDIISKKNGKNKVVLVNPQIAKR